MNKKVHTRCCRSRAVVVVLFAVHTALLSWSALRHSPVVLEPAHLAAGLAHIEKSRFDLYRVNPPLVRIVAATPAALLGAKTDWVRDDPNPQRRCEFDVGQDFLAANSARSMWLVTLGRWACIPFSLLGAYICYRWATELFGHTSGTIALALWCLSPSILAHAALLTPDAAAASMALTAAYAFHHWVSLPTWPGALIGGLLLGLAELTKTTLVVLYPVFLLLWIVSRIRGRSFASFWLDATQLSALLTISIVVINAGYGFEGSGKPIDTYQFQSRLLGGSEDQGPDFTGNRLARLGLSQIPLPLPANYVQGIDTQRLDFERTKRSYLNGQWRTGGWPHFYLVALAVKTPLGTMVLLLLSLWLFASRAGVRTNALGELALILPPLVILAVASSQTGISIHPRYVLPAAGFAFVWISRVGTVFSLRHGYLATTTVAALTASSISTLWCYPHELSYFNEAAGGPRRGHHYLLDSGIAWGQDLFFLSDWLADHPEASPCYLAAFGYANPTELGIDFRLPTAVSTHRKTASNSSPATLPPAGWYVIDVNHLMGTDEAVATPGGTRKLLASSGRDLSVFKRLRPVARAGYSYLIYRIRPDDTSDTSGVLAQYRADP